MSFPLRLILWLTYRIILGLQFGNLLCFLLTKILNIGHQRLMPSASPPSSPPPSPYSLPFLPLPSSCLNFALCSILLRLLTIPADRTTTTQVGKEAPHDTEDHSRLAWLYVEVRLVEFLVVEAVPPPLGVCLPCPFIIEVAVTHCALEGGMGELGVISYSNHKLLP